MKTKEKFIPPCKQWVPGQYFTCMAGWGTASGYPNKYQSCQDKVGWCSFYPPNKAIQPTAKGGGLFRRELVYKMRGG